MKNLLFGGLILVGALLNAPNLHAQDVETAPTLESTFSPTPAPAPEINVDVQPPAPPPAPDVTVEVPAPPPAPAPEINVEVPPSAPSTRTETKETSVTRVIQHQPDTTGSDLAFLLVGGGIAALAVAGLFAASTRR